MKDTLKKYDEIIRKVDKLVLDHDIIDILEGSYYTENRSYLSEYPSIIIYLSYRLINCDDKEYSNHLFNRINYYLQELLNSIKLNRTNNISLCYGFTGYVYTLEFLSKNSKGYDKLLDTLETILLTLTKDRLNEIKKSNTLKEEYFDVIQGVSSVAKYLLSKEKLTSEQGILVKEILNYLADLINDKPIIYKEHTSNEKLRERFPDGYINLGVAHGMLGPLYVLTLGFEKIQYNKILTFDRRGLALL